MVLLEIRYGWFGGGLAHGDCVTADRTAANRAAKRKSRSKATREASPETSREASPGANRPNDSQASRQAVTPTLRNARLAILGYFFLLGGAGATWAARLPAIKAGLHLTDGRLGLVLFAMPAGSVLTLPLSGRIVDAFGQARVMRAAGVTLAVALVALGLPTHLPVLMVAAACYGAVAGLLDVAMNAAGSRLERGYGRPILSSLHAGYSVAGIAGAGVGGLFAWQRVSPRVTFAAVAVPLAGFAIIAARWADVPDAPAHHEPARTRKLSPRQILIAIWVLGLLGLCGQIGEGSAGDWSAVYLHTNLHAAPGVAALGIVAFSAAMTAGRIAGDQLAARFGPAALVRGSGLLAGLGLAGGLLIPSAAAAIAGFALLGAGLAGIFPQVVSTAGRLDPARAGRNISTIAAVSYTGLLGGPVAIGAIAGGIGLRNALLIPAGLSLLAAALAGVMRQPAGEQVPAPALEREALAWGACGML